MINDITPPEKPKSDRPAPPIEVLEDDVIKQGKVIYEPSSE